MNHYSQYGSILTWEEVAMPWWAWAILAVSIWGGPGTVFSVVKRDLENGVVAFVGRLSLLFLLLWLIVFWVLVQDFKRWQCGRRARTEWAKRHATA